PSRAARALPFGTRGTGIAAEKLGAVFERFTQADSSTTRKHGGSGLGLTMSKRLVELMGGRIWDESGVGKGSVVSFAVPLEISRRATQRAAVLPGTGPAGALPGPRSLAGVRAGGVVRAAACSRGGGVARQRHDHGGLPEGHAVPGRDRRKRRD